MDLDDMICVRYDTHAHDLSFKNQEFWISTTKLLFWVDLYVVHPSTTIAKAK